jgi:transposase
MLQQERNRLEANRLDEWIRPRVQQHVQQLRDELKAVEQRIWAHLTAHESLKSIWRRLQTIVGIGPLGAAALIAHIGEIERFAHAGAVVSLAGLAVKEDQSGSSVRGKPQIDRHGREPLRQLLYMCALVAIRWDAHMRAWAQRLRARGKPFKVVIVAVMRKLVHIVYGVWTSGQDYDPGKAFPLQAALEPGSHQAA